VNLRGVWETVTVFACLALALAGGARSTGEHFAQPTRPSARLASTYTGIAVGGVDRYGQSGNESDPNAVFAISEDSYRVRIAFTFRVSGGLIRGSGKGQYTSLTWHLHGRNGAQGSFDCRIPVVGKTFTVSVSGTAQLPILDATISTNDANEHNDAYACGAGYSGFATDSTFIQESLARVLSNVKFDATKPVIPPLTHDEQQGSPANGGNFRKSHDEWSLSIAPPGQTLAPPPMGSATGSVLVNGQPFTSGAIPYGSTIDVTSGTLTMTTDVGTFAVYSDGVNPAQAIVTRTSERVKNKKQPLVQLALTGGDFTACAARRSSARAPGSGQKPNPKPVRSLWGKGKGRFRTKGRYSSATVRGTEWLTTDRCDGTLTTVKQGVVTVKDLTRKKTVKVSAGKSYLAPAHRP
jgi:hypothetical protein